MFLKPLKLVLLTILFSTYSYSQPCLPDCPGDQWTPAPLALAYVITVSLPCGTFQVGYRSRIACGQYYDYYIEIIGSLTSAIQIQNCVNSSYGGD